MKGGVVHNQSHDSIHDAITYFLENSTLEILTNSSISCVTFVATLNPVALSSLISSRDNTFGKPVTKLLIKLFPISLTSLKKSTINFLNGERGHRKEIEVTTLQKFENEFNTQRAIYNETYNDDPICPCPIHITIKLISYVDTLLKNLTTEQKKNLSDMFRVIKSNNVSHVGILYMEMLVDCFLLKNVMNSPHFTPSRKEFFTNMFRYEIDRLHEIGYCHKDIHSENAMVDTYYPYLTKFDESRINRKYLGRVFLIDFGRSIKTKNEKHFIKEDNRLLEEGIIYNGNIFDKEASYETIKERRSEFNEEMEKERAKEKETTEFVTLKNYILKKIIDTSDPIKMSDSTIETKPTSWFASSARSARSALSTLSKIPLLLSRTARTTRTTKVLPVESPNPDVRYYLGGQQRTRPSYVNTRRRRRRKKVPTKHKRATRVTSRKKRNSKNNL